MRTMTLARPTWTPTPLTVMPRAGLVANLIRVLDATAREPEPTEAVELLGVARRMQRQLPPALR